MAKNRTAGARIEFEVVRNRQSFSPAGENNAALMVTKARPSLILSGPAANTVAHLVATNYGPALTLYGPGGKREASFALSGDGCSLHMSDAGARTEAKLDMSEDEPSLRIQDAEGFRTVVGTIGLVTEKTGEQHKTSAASVTILGKDGKMIWSAP